MANPIVSVVIPTFNNAALLPDTLDGVKRQTFENLEVIVVDDGSSDDTADIVSLRYPEFVYYHQTNHGQAAARNKGASLARGDYVAFCDHDDVWNERHIERLVDCFRSHPNAGMVFDNARCFIEGLEHKLYLEPKVSKFLNQKAISSNYLLWNYPVASMSVVMVRKYCFQRLHGLSSTAGAMDDYHFYLRMAASYDVRYVDYVGCGKYLGDLSLSSRVNLKETNVVYLEDIFNNHPDVVQKIGGVSFRRRLGKKYFKLGQNYWQRHEPLLARDMFRKAFRIDPFNIRYILRYLGVKCADGMKVHERGSQS